MGTGGRNTGGQAPPLPPDFSGDGLEIAYIKGYEGFCKGRSY
jgi:hypothetical protein